MNACSRIGKRFLLAALLAVWLALASGGACAQGGAPAVNAKLLDPEVDAGEPTEYQIIVDGGQADRPPPVPIQAGLTFQYLGISQSVFLDNSTGFRPHRSFVYRYAVRAMRAGRYVIPAQDVTVNGNVVHTPALTLTAGDTAAPGATPPDRALSSELIIPKKSAYLGESIPVEVRSFFGSSVSGHPDPDPVLAGEGFSVQKFTGPAIRSAVVEGIHYSTASYKSAIAGLKIGTLTVGPAETAPVVRMPVSPSRRRDDPYDPFGGLFGGRNLMQQEQQIKVRTDPVTLEIKPLPTGKPADFSGGIGQFKLDVETDSRRAQAGDPVTVRLVLSGQGNFERVSPPVLADERGLKTYPPTSKFKADDEVGLSGVKTFEQVIIADSARTSLPSYRFSYLDPGTGKYVSLDTPPVPVRIEGSAATPAPVAAVVAQAALMPTATPSPTPTPRAAEDILYIRADPGAARDRADFLPVYQRRGFWLAQGVPLAGLLIALAGLGLRARARNESARRQARLQREQGELQRALRREDASRRDFYGAATRLAQLRAARGRADVPSTAAEISQARGLDPQTARSVQEIFHRRDELVYSGGGVALEPVPAEERRGVLATLETLGKNGK